MIFNISKLEHQNRAESILYSSSNIITYRQANQIVTASCDGTIISSFPSPVDYMTYEMIEQDDYIVFIFRGSKIVTLYKDGNIDDTYDLHPIKIGTSITKILPGDHKNRIILGTKKNNKIQFINYDFITKERINQTLSWTAQNITGVFKTPNHILYAVLDNSIIVACDMTTGETLWSRFETAKVNKGIFESNGNVFYTCHGLLKTTDGKTAQSTKIPLVNISTIEHINDQNLYISYDDGSKLGCYNIQSQQFKWELSGKNIVASESFVAQKTDGANLLITNTPHHVIFINLDQGIVESSIYVPYIFKLRITGDNVLIQKESGTTSIIYGAVQ